MEVSVGGRDISWQESTRAGIRRSGSMEPGIEDRLVCVKKSVWIERFR